MGRASLREIFKGFVSSVTWYDYKIADLDTLLYHSWQILMIELHQPTDRIKYWEYFPPLLLTLIIYLWYHRCSQDFVIKTYQQNITLSSPCKSCILRCWFSSGSMISDPFDHRGSCCNFKDWLFPLEILRMVAEESKVEGSGEVVRQSN